MRPADMGSLVHPGPKRNPGLGHGTGEQRAEVPPEDGARDPVGLNVVGPRAGRIGQVLEGAETRGSRCVWPVSRLVTSMLARSGRSTTPPTFYTGTPGARGVPGISDHLSGAGDQEEYMKDRGTNERGKHGYPEACTGYPRDGAEHRAGHCIEQHDLDHYSVPTLPTPISASPGSIHLMSAGSPGSGAPGQGMAE